MFGELSLQLNFSAHPALLALLNTPSAFVWIIYSYWTVLRSRS